MIPTPLSPPEAQALRKYLTDRWQTPEEYIVSLFTSRDVVLLAEDHCIRNNLELAHRLIPRLYAAGVRNFGMEFGAHEDQTTLDRLVSGEIYDEDIARRLMFNYNVGWAYHEYMQVYQVAWAFNQTLPGSAPRFRILNLSYTYNWQDAPTVRTPTNAQKIYPHGPVDAYRAEVVCREVLERSEKILILTGTYHAFTRYHIPVFDFNAPEFTRFEARNLGHLLYREAPDRLACILLHQPFDDRLLGGARQVFPACGAIDQVMSGFAKPQAGFDLPGTPFGDLPDDSYYATGSPDFHLSHLADGYVYLGPFNKLQGCRLDPAFLTEENWLEAQRQFPDPDWHARPKSLKAFWAQIRAYRDLGKRYRDVR